MRNIVTTFRGKPIPSDVRHSLERQDPKKLNESSASIAILRGLRVHPTVGATFAECRRMVAHFIPLSLWDLGKNKAGQPRYLDIIHNIGKHQDASPHNACALGLFYWDKGHGYVLKDDDLTQAKCEWLVCLASQGKDLSPDILEPVGDFNIISTVTTIIQRNNSANVTLSYVMESPLLRKYKILDVTRALARSSPIADGIMMSTDPDPVLRIRQRTQSRPVVPQPKSVFID